MATPKSFPLVNLPPIKELECLGFQLGNMNLNFRKGFLEVTCGYKLVDEPSDRYLCERFLDALKHGPKSMVDQASSFMGGDAFKNFQN